MGHDLPGLLLGLGQLLLGGLLEGLLGLGAGLFHKNKYRAYIGTVAGGALMFLSFYLVGVFIWGKYMPEEFLGLTMTSPWIYSFLYNTISVGPNVVLTLILFALLHRVKPIRKQLLPEEL